MDAELDATALRRAFNRAAENFPRNVKWSIETEKAVMAWWSQFYAAITTSDEGLKILAELAELRAEVKRLKRHEA